MTADERPDADPDETDTSSEMDTHTEPEADPEPDASQDSGEPSCWNCGSPLPDGAMFCGECGSAVGPRGTRMSDLDGLRAGEPATGEPSPGPDGSSTPPHGDALLPGAVDPPSPDSAPTAVQTRVDSAEPPHGDPIATGVGSVEHVDPAEDPGEDDPGGDDADGDPLAPLTAEERFAAERLLDPDSPAEKFVLQFSTGESATVYGSGLVGRNPVAEPGEYMDHLVVIRDSGRSVSKTHLEFGQENGRFWVLDRFSGNGSALREPDGAPKRCEPGRRYFVSRGTRIEIGDQFLVVS